MDRNGVAVTAPRDERTHDGIPRIVHTRGVSLTPRQPATTDELKLTHPAILASDPAGRPDPVHARTRPPPHSEPIGALNRTIHRRPFARRLLRKVASWAFPRKRWAGPCGGRR